MSDACFHTEDATCPNCALARMFGAFPEIPDGFAVVGDLSPSEYADAATIARQARTIRRLRALATGYRENLSHCLEERGIDMENAMRGERARIVAAIGASVWTGSLYPPEVHAAVKAIRDAIERGEL